MSKKLEEEKAELVKKNNDLDTEADRLYADLLEAQKRAGSAERKSHDVERRRRDMEKRKSEAEKKWRQS